MSKTLVKSETFNNTPIGNFPLDWDIVAIGDIAIFVGSGITPKGGSNVYKKEGILFIRSQNVTFEGLLLDDVAHIDERIHKIMKRSEVFAHDVLLNITGASIGRCCPLPEGLGTANVNQHVCAIRLPNPNRDNAIFLSSVLASYIGESQINKLNAGGNREGLNYQQLRAFLIPFPPTQERADIAKILDAIDKAIALTDTHITKLKKAKAGLLHDLLTRGIDEHGELRDYTRNPELFKRSPLGIIPKDWDVEPLHKHTLSSAFGPRFSSSLYADDGNVATLRTTDMDEEGNLDLSTMPLAHLNLGLFNLHILEVGDLLISRSGTCGITAVFSRFNIPVLPGAFLIRFRLKESVKAEFIRRYFNYELGRARVLNEAEGGVQKNLRGSTLLKLLIPIPPKQEQDAIIHRLQCYESRIITKKICLDKLKLLKKGLMSDLLTGRVRVKT